MPERRPVRVDALPPQIKRALLADSRQTGRSVNYIVTQVIADLYGYTYEGRSDPGRKPKLDERLVVKVPHDLWLRLRVAVAEQPGATIRQTVIDALADHYNITLKGVKK